jgi:protoporphyrinogen oxidase
MSEAVIIGAGPAGLTAAYELSKFGIASRVIEADNQVGGLSRTVNYNGYRFDIGGHRFFSKVQLINDLWHEILNEDFLPRPRLSRIYYSNHFFDYPLKAANALAGLGPVEAMLVTLSYAKSKLMPHHEETNFEQWVSNRFGQRLYEIFFKSYTEKVWGVPCSEISADWASQRIKNLTLNQAVRNALLGDGKKDGQVITSLIEAFHYPRFGPGMMWERCEQLLAAKGAETLRGIKVDRIRHSGGRVQCIFGHTSSGERVDFPGSDFISTMPLRTLIRSLDPLPPDEVLAAAGGLRYRDYLTVVLIVNRPQVFPDNWIYIHTPDVKVGRIQNYKNWSPDMVPDQSRTSLGLEYFLWDKDEMWQWTDERLIEFGTRECAKIGIVNPTEIEDGTVVRMKKAYPIYDHLYRESLSIVRGYLDTVTNLQTIGRNGLHRYNNQDHSMLTGIYAARNVTGERHDVWAVNTEKDYHETTVNSRSYHSSDRLVPGPSDSSTVVDEMVEAVFARLDPIALGAALGLVSAVLLFLSTAMLLVKGGAVIGPNLSLLTHYLIGFKVSWTGAIVGLLEGAIVGFLIGYIFAYLRNIGMTAYATVIKWRSQREAPNEVLDKL